VRFLQCPEVHPISVAARVLSVLLGQLPFSALRCLGLAQDGF
jgi:hypothetical protein